MTPAQQRRAAEIERRIVAELAKLRALATEVSGDPDPDLFYEADGCLHLMPASFRDETGRETIRERTETSILSIRLGIGSGAW